MKNFTKHNWVKVTAMVMVCVFLYSQIICTGELYVKKSHLRKKSSADSRALVIDKKSLMKMFRIDHFDYLIAHYLNSNFVFMHDWVDNKESKTLKDKVDLHWCEIIKEFEGLQDKIEGLRYESQLSPEDVKRIYLEAVDFIGKNKEIAIEFLQSMKFKKNKEPLQRSIQDALNFVEGIKILLDEEQKEIDVNDTLRKMIGFIFSGYFFNRGYKFNIKKIFSDDLIKITAPQDKLAYLFINLLSPQRREDTNFRIETRNNKNGIQIKITSPQEIYLEAEQYKYTYAGYGLAEKITAELGGSIEILKTAGKPTGFLVKLPSGRIDSSAVDVKVKGNSNPVPAKRGIRILMADDDYGFIQLAALELSSKNPSLKIETARDGREAWKKFQTNPFDIVTTDNDMPFMNGSELSQKIKGLKPETYIIMQSGRSYPRNAKIDTFLDKGNIELFYEAIGKAKAAVESRLTSAAKPLPSPINSVPPAVTASL